MPQFFQVSVPTVRSLEQNSLRVRKSKPLFNRMQVASGATSAGRGRLEIASGTVSRVGWFLFLLFFFMMFPRVAREWKVDPDRAPYAWCASHRPPEQEEKGSGALARVPRGRHYPYSLESKTAPEGFTQHSSCRLLQGVFDVKF
ncbi:hypothetical protein J6590_021057 [Homalodisca vitripennis]|nr:hypothetical protein J6590_021057 [Homalodisca vitripennis]